MSVSDNTMLSFTKLSKLYGVHQHTISDLVRKHDIPCYESHLGGKAKLVDAEGIKTLDALIGPHKVSIESFAPKRMKTSA